MIRILCLSSSIAKQMSGGKLLLILSCLTWHQAISQSSYIKTNSTLEIGIGLKAGNDKQNAQVIRKKTEDGIEEYSPSNVIEYGLKDGSVYRSLSIGSDSKRYFFQQLSSGKYDLYYLPVSFHGDKFYITTDDKTLTPLPTSRRLFRSAISSYVKDCEQAVKNSRHVRRTKSSLGRFFNDYEVCSRSYLPRPHIGLTFGVSFVKFKPHQAPEPISGAKFSRLNEFTFGIFAEYPIRKSNLSIATHPTVYNYDRWTYFASTENSHLLAFDEWRLSVPLLFRYTFLNRKTSPFLEAGPALSFNLKGDIRHYTYQQVGDDIFIEEERRPDLIPKTQVGLTTGIGFIARQNSTYSLMFQCRINKFYVAHDQHGSLKSNEVVFNVGLLF
jgi:hypothetical protein